ncbi:MAG: dimethylhistidine N-methyltransferase [Rhodocyclales bacterium]|nr:dimethylhistidine N-methyltransferase [Rhodocyclales bacterium]
MNISPVFDRPDNIPLSETELVWHTRELPNTTVNPVIARQFSDEVLGGLCRPAKAIPATWLYDVKGSALFEEISAQPEYYLRRAETTILQANLPTVREIAGCGASIIEMGCNPGFNSGSNSCSNTAMLLDALQASSYAPINICPEVLDASVNALRQRFPDMSFLPQHADFRMPMSLPAAFSGQGRRLAFLPGSTIGSLMPLESVVCMQRIRQLLGTDGLLLLGQDTTRAPDALLPAYDDAMGASAAFNRNLLTRINRELEGSFDLSKFRHEARFNHRLGRVEMHLVSGQSQWVEVSDRAVHFETGESIHTQNSYKYSVDEFLALSQSAGWSSLHVWVDHDSRFAVHLLSAGTRH